jgi:O-antigen ligase
MIVWVLTLAVTQAIGLAGFDFSVLGRANRLAGLARNPNELAFYSVTGICFVLYFLVNTRGTLRRVWLSAALALGTLSVLLSASRGGLLVLVVVLLYTVASTRLVQGLRLSGITVLVAAALLLTTRLDLSYVSDLAAGLTRTATEIAQGRSSEHRVRIVRSGLRSWSEHPFFGVGLGVGKDVQAYDARGQKTVTASHSTYLTALVETGVIGLILFCGLLFSTWSNLSQHVSPGQRLARMQVDLDWAWRTVLLNYLLMSLTGGLLFNKVFWVTVGASIIIRRRPDALGYPTSARE